jgi:catechol 2,3-dioxygenase-like lactoylglutathione lyase family enzyme
MVGYVTLGTLDLARGAKFYDAIAKELGVGRMMETERFIAWGSPGGGAGLGLTKPFDGKPCSVGNGVMVALEAKDKAQVDRLYKIAMSLGGTDEGPPGQRNDGFYAAYFRDLDGNKLNAFWMG